MFDTHAHLSDSCFNLDRDRVIKNAVQEGISGIICVCSDFKELDVFYRLLEKYDFIYGAVGIHPHDAAVHKKLQAKLYQTLTHNKIVALGEIGLDYHYENSPRKIQKEVFQYQLALAKQKKLPVIIHSREAMKDTLKILKQQEIHRGVIHCFSGTEEDMKVCLDMGLYISLAGPVTFPKASKVQNIARLVPLERLIVETDSPYLAPQPVRGKRNQPVFVKYVIQKISFLKGILENNLNQITTQNARKLFNLDL